MTASAPADEDLAPSRVPGGPDIAMTTPEQLPDLAEELSRRGVDDESLARVFGGNWMRVARQVWRA